MHCVRMLTIFLISLFVDELEELTRQVEELFLERREVDPPS